jgi:vancomycin permeability regulator SanA
MSAPRHRYVAARPAPRSNLRKLGPNRWAYRQPVRPYRAGFVFMRRAVFLLLAILAVVLIVNLGLQLYVDGQTQDLVYSPDSDDLPRQHVAIVFGAGLNQAGGPSAMLYDRVQVAADLYKNNKVDKLLMTGDNSAVNYNEVEVMRKTAVELGVDDEDIVLDYAGFSTWDSCYRAHEVFGLNQATLVTQKFHLPRALFACKQLGVKPVGVAADVQSYPTTWNEIREFPAIFSTFWNIATNRQPQFLGPKVNVDEPQQR